MNHTKQRSTRSHPTATITSTYATLTKTFGAFLLTSAVSVPVAAQTSAAPSSAAPSQAAPSNALGSTASSQWQMPAAPPTQGPPAPRTGTAPPPASATPQPATRPHPNASGYTYDPRTYNGYPQYPAGYPQPGQPPAAGAPIAPPDQAEDDEPSPPFFDLALGTYVPLSLGGQATLELPGRLLLQMDVGWMPPAYGSAINGLVEAVGGYDAALAEVINGSLEDAVVVRVSGGWRPFSNAGFEIYGGYTHIALSGSVSPASVASIVGGDFANQVAGQVLTENVDVSSKLHNFHVALGWRFVAFDHLVIRTTLGYTQTVGSSSSVETPQVPEAAAIANPIVDAEMSKIYNEYVKLPVIGLSGGYRF